MNSDTVERWIKGLGQPASTLAASHTIPDTPLQELFEGDDRPYINPTPGVDLIFDKQTQRLIEIVFDLKPLTTSSQPYTGMLPHPFSRNMTQTSVREVWGVPIRSLAPRKAPKPIGQAGGLDAYKADSWLSDVEVIFTYNSHLEVATLAFLWIESRQ